MNSQGEEEELIVFGGLARNACNNVQDLDEDEETLLFSVANGVTALKNVLTVAERRIYEAVSNVSKPFTFTQVTQAAKTTNRKAATSRLRKAEAQGVIRKHGSGSRVRYEIVK